MATPLCSSGDEQPGVLIVGVLATGEQIVLCEDCVPGWCGAVLGSVLGLDIEPWMTELFATAAGDDEPVPGPEELEEAPEVQSDPPVAAKPPRGRTRAGSSVPATADDNEAGADEAEVEK